MASAYDVPNWAGKPPPGLHLDIFKDDKFVQKIMIDEKKVSREKYFGVLFKFYWINFPPSVLPFWKKS